MGKNKNSGLKFLIWLIFLFFISFFVFKIYLGLLISPKDPNGKIKAFIVQKGDTLRDVSEHLEEKGFIKSSFGMRLYLKFSRKDFRVESGDFKLSAAMGISEIVDTLSRGAVDKWTTIVEGLRVEEIAEKLNQDLKIEKGEFIKKGKIYEGYLFPDTYLFNKDATVDTIISTLKNTFTQKYTEEIQSKIKLKGLTPEQGVILASIVEREARSDEVRTKVASILLKRLKIGMALQVDATVQYALGYQPQEKSWWKRHLSKEDLTLNSPFNTYLNPGLPPDPICNPSISSLKAVSSVDTSTPYLYYYHDSKGNSYYSKTLDEHNENVASHP